MKEVYYKILDWRVLKTSPEFDSALMRNLKTPFYFSFYSFKGYHGSLLKRLNTANCYFTEEWFLAYIMKVLTKHKSDSEKYTLVKLTTAETPLFMDGQQAVFSEELLNQAEQVTL